MVRLLSMVLAVLSCLPAAEPVVIGVDLEFGARQSTSASAVERGVRLAIDEINARGGVLGGRPLRIERRDHRGIPARAVADLHELAAIPDLVAVVHGKLSPAVAPCVPLAKELRVPLLLTWSTASPLVSNGQDPNWCFRLSLRDEWVAPALVNALRDRGLKRFAALLPATSWGTSNQEALRAAIPASGLELTTIEVYPFGAQDLSAEYARIRASGAEALLLVANEMEGAALLRLVSQLPANERLPIVSHWGITGGDLPKLVGPTLAQLDLRVVQTFSLLDPPTPLRQRVLAALLADGIYAKAEDIPSPIGIGHAYDLTHLLARAIDRAGTTDRNHVRDALEHLEPYEGLVTRYQQPFTPERHEALTPEIIFFAAWDEAGVLRRMPGAP